MHNRTPPPPPCLLSGGGGGGAATGNASGSSTSTTSSSKAVASSSTAPRAESPFNHSDSPLPGPHATLLVSAGGGAAAGLSPQHSLTIISSSSSRKSSEAHGASSLSTPSGGLPVFCAPHRGVSSQRDSAPPGAPLDTLGSTHGSTYGSTYASVDLDDPPLHFYHVHSSGSAHSHADSSPAKSRSGSLPSASGQWGAHGHALQHQSFVRDPVPFAPPREPSVHHQSMPSFCDLLHVPAGDDDDATRAAGTDQRRNAAQQQHAAESLALLLRAAGTAHSELEDWSHSTTPMLSPAPLECETPTEPPRRAGTSSLSFPLPCREALFFTMVAAAPPQAGALLSDQ